MLTLPMGDLSFTDHMSWAHPVYLHSYVTWAGSRNRKFLKSVQRKPNFPVWVHSQESSSSWLSVQDWELFSPMDPCHFLSTKKHDRSFSINGLLTEPGICLAFPLLIRNICQASYVPSKRSPGLPWPSATTFMLMQTQQLLPLSCSPSFFLGGR